jgi:hypothetical protein
MKSLTVFNCGIKVHISILDKEGMITAINIRDDRVQYGVTYNVNGDVKESWFSESELEISGRKNMKIGFMLEDGV